MNEESNKIIDITEENKPLPYCTVSKQVYLQDDNYLMYFSLGKKTDISCELYEYPKLYIIYQGILEIYDNNGNQWILNKYDAFMAPINIPIGVKSKDECIYMEIGFKKGTKMNNIIKSKEVFKLKDLIPYHDGKVINMDIASNDKMKFVIMSFDEKTGLTEHAAPAEALVMALDGEAIIGYEGHEYLIKEGETFKFDKYGKHYIKAQKKFKMALLLTFD